MFAHGVTPEEYPTMDSEKIAIAPVYMQEFTRPGRPSRYPWRGRGPRGRKSFPPKIR